MKKLTIPLVILLVCVFIVAGCSSGTTTAPAPATSAATTAAPTTTVTSKPAATTSAPVITSTAAPATSKPAATSTAPTTTAGQKYGGLIRYIAPTGPGAPIGAPWLSNGTSTFVMQFAENSLLKMKLDATIVPSLASSYEVVSDPTKPSITFKLAKGIKFHDGTDFNAQAVKFNFDKTMAPGSTTSTSNWKSVEVIDDYTVRVNFKTFINTAVLAFADAIFMVSPTAFQTNGADWMNYNMVGTGPFIQKDFMRDVSLSYNKNTSYWEAGKPYLDKFQMLFVSDPMTAEALFKSGGAEMIQCADDAQAARLESAGVKMERVFSYGGTLVPDSGNADSPWSNLKVRMAAEYALDKEALAKAYGFGTWQAAYQHSGVKSPAYDATLAPRKYDTAKAKQLLTEAGYPNGFKTNIIVGATGASRDVGQAIQAYWGKVGIEAALQFPQTSAWSAYLSPGIWKNAVLYGASQGYANPLSGWNLAYAEGATWYQSMKKPNGWKEAYAAALATPNLDPVLAKKCEALLFNDVNTIPLYTSAKQWGVTTNVIDSGLGTRGLWAWWDHENVWLGK